MNSKVTLPLFAAAVIFGLAQPMLAASKKNEPRREALVAALQLVSKDALGGRLGLDIAIANAPMSSASESAQRLGNSTAHSADLVAYRSWKSARKS